MKLFAVLICTLAVVCCVSSAPQKRTDEENEVEEQLVLTKAVPCDPQVCVAPACRCSSTVLDKDIPIEKTPQVGMTSFKVSPIKQYFILFNKQKS